MTGRKVRWGILGTGYIARVFAKGIAGSTSGELIGVASRDLKRAQDFGKEAGAAHCYGSYDALLSDAEIDVVYIALPNALHAEWAVRAARRGKHVLCEKPLAVNAIQAQSMIDAAAENGVFLMEGFMYRCHPQTAKLQELLRAKAIGDIRVIQAAFSFHADRKTAGSALSVELAGGGILDVGCYPVSMARLIAGVALGKEYTEPIEVRGLALIGEQSGIDEWSVCCLKFPMGILAQLSAGVFLDQENVVRVFGSEGDLFIPSPWVPGGREPGVTKIILRRPGEKVGQEILTETTLGLYSFEADAVAAHLGSGECPAMCWQDSLGNMQVLDLWRQAIGLQYPADLSFAPVGK